MLSIYQNRLITDKRIFNLATLHTYFRSSAAYRVRIFLALKGLEYQKAFVNLRQGQQTAKDYQQINAQGLIPAWEDDSGSYSQSLAIMLFIEDKYPTPALLPSDPAKKAQVLSVVQHIACDIHPLNNLRVLNYLKNTLHLGAAAVDDWYAHWIQLGFDALETILSQTAGRYCFGDTPTFADCFLIPQIYNAIRFNVELSAYPTLCRIYEYANTQPAFIAAMPKNQEDAVE